MLEAAEIEGRRHFSRRNTLVYDTSSFIMKLKCFVPIRLMQSIFGIVNIGMINGGNMKFLTLILMLTAHGCGTEKNSGQGDSFELVDVPTGKSGNHKYYIECNAERYDWQAWEKLGTFRSKSVPEVNNGELSSTAQETYNGIMFSSDGNYDEGLIYFGMIWDNEAKIGSELQLAQKDRIDLYLSTEQYKYSLHCEMKQETE